MKKDADIPVENDIEENEKELVARISAPRDSELQTAESGMNLE